MMSRVNQKGPHGLDPTFHGSQAVGFGLFGDCLWVSVEDIMNSEDGSDKPVAEVRCFVNMLSGV